MGATNRPSTRAWQQKLESMNALNEPYTGEPDDSWALFRTVGGPVSNEVFKEAYERTVARFGARPAPRGPLDPEPVRGAVGVLSDEQWENALLQEIRIVATLQGQAITTTGSLGERVGLNDPCSKCGKRTTVLLDGACWPSCGDEGVS